MFPFPHAPQAHAAFFEQQAQQQLRQSQMFGGYLPQQPHPAEEQYLVYGGPEYAGFPYPQGPYYDEFEDIGEPSTRPRLTKEQVEVLEKQFQDNHKPTSMQKRQLAMQTMLSLPRVAVREPQVHTFPLLIFRRTGSRIEGQRQSSRRSRRSTKTARREILLTSPRMTSPRQKPWSVSQRLLPRTRLVATCHQTGRRRHPSLLLPMLLTIYERVD